MAIHSSKTLWHHCQSDRYTEGYFVSTVKTDPLHGDLQFILKDQKNDFQLGINLLNKLVDEPVFLGVDKEFSDYFESIEGVQHYTVRAHTLLAT